MKYLCIDDKKITNLLDCDRITGAVLDKFLILQVDGEATISMRRKIDWAFEIGVKSDTVSRKIRHLVKIGMLEQKDKKTYVMSGMYYDNINNRVGFFKRLFKRKKKKQKQLFFEN